jgi:hypothetical protein
MEPVNFAEVIFQTDVEMQRLGWTPEQGREHLKKNYGKRGRTLLTEVELLDFLQYLASLPTPVLDEALIAKINLEIERLCWTEKEGQGHLKRNYGKRSLTLLTELELLDFFQYLASQPLDEVVAAKTNIEIEQLCWTQQQGQINAEIERLCWMKEKEQKYVIKTSRKQNTNLLTQEELLEFAKYLESEPTVKYPSNLDAENQEFQDLSELLAKFE